MKKPLTFICRQKIKFILHVFLEILQRYCKLIVLGTLGIHGYTNPKSYYQLAENFGVHLQAKNLVHPPPSISAHNSRTRILPDMGLRGDINNISFHFRYFSKKTNHKIFQKISKTLFWDHFGPFLPKFRKKINIPEKKSCQFLDIPIIYHRAKNQKKLTNHF